MAKLLVCDDEINICNLIRKYSQYEGHSCDMANNGKTALKMLENNQYDLLILDVMMPVLNGWDTIKELRNFSSIPVIMLTAKKEEEDRIEGFELGVDDYVTKPFSVKELMYRINAILKRINKYKDKSDIYKTLKIDYHAQAVYIDKEAVKLSPKERELLFYLCSNKNIALEREQIITQIWGYDYEGDDRTLDTHIKLLRKDLKEYGDLIKTIRGVGYRFEIPE